MNTSRQASLPGAHTRIPPLPISGGRDHLKDAGCLPRAKRTGASSHHRADGLIRQGHEAGGGWLLGATYTLPSDRLSI